MPIFAENSDLAISPVVQHVAMLSISIYSCYYWDNPPQRDQAVICVQDDDLFDISCKIQ